MNWYVRNQIIDLTMPKIMAIWNVSPDSFSSFCEEENAAGTAHAERLCAEGADILDIGAVNIDCGIVREGCQVNRLVVGVNRSRFVVGGSRQRSGHGFSVVDQPVHIGVDVRFILRIDIHMNAQRTLPGRVPYLCPGMCVI